MYRVEFAAVAERQLKRLPTGIQDRLRAEIRELGLEPRPPGSQKLTAPRPLYRIRVGDYRVVYEIRDAASSIVIAAVGLRKDIYRHLPSGDRSRCRDAVDQSDQDVEWDGVRLLVVLAATSLDHRAEHPVRPNLDLDPGPVPLSFELEPTVRDRRRRP